MANLSNFAEEAILKHLLGQASFSMPTTLYVTIFSDTATDAELESGDFTNEITDYTETERATVTFTDPTQVDGKATVETADQIEFTGMPAVTVGYYALCDSATHGDGEILVWGGPDGQAQSISAGNNATIPAGDITITLD